MFDEQDLSALWVTLKLASVSTLILLLLGIPMAWWLFRSQARFKWVVEAIIALPIVLPPTVLGFYLLIILGPRGWVGKITEFLGLGSLAFTFWGLVIGSVLYSLPFVVHPIRQSFDQIGMEPLEAAWTLGLSPRRAFSKVMLPLAKPGLFTATILGFAHTVGEFGVVLMLGGNIPGKTRVLSIAIYDHVEQLNYSSAHRVSLLLLIVSFLLLAGMLFLRRGKADG